MTHKKRRMILLVLALAVFLFFIWYTSPRTAEELFSDFQWENVTEISGTYNRYEENDHSAKAPIRIQGTVGTISLDSESGKALLSLLQDVEYRRSLENLVPARGRSYGPLRPEDLEVEVRCQVEGAPGYLTVCYYYDKMIVSTAESKEYTCSATGQNHLAQELLKLLQPLATEETFH